EAGQLLSRVGRGRIDGGPRLRHRHLGELELRIAGEKVGDQLVRLARGGAVADGDELRLVADGERLEHAEALVPAPLRLMRIDRRRLDDLAGRVDHGDLDPGAETRIEADGRPPAGGRREQEVAEIGGEHPYRLVL